MVHSTSISSDMLCGANLSGRGTIKKTKRRRHWMHGARRLARGARRHGSRRPFHGARRHVGFPKKINDLVRGGTWAHTIFYPLSYIFFPLIQYINQNPSPFSPKTLTLEKKESPSTTILSTTSNHHFLPGFRPKTSFFDISPPNHHRPSLFTLIPTPYPPPSLHIKFPPFTILVLRPPPHHHTTTYHHHRSQGSQG